MSPAYIFTASSPGTTVQASATSSATPSCGQWVQATAGDSCWKLSQDHCLEGVDAFLGLNPQLRGDCRRVWDGENYCIRLSDGPVCVVRTLTVVPEPLLVEVSSSSTMTTTAARACATAMDRGDRGS
ncbi:hypothetical protein PG987_012262 [Apiospora arundinis]